MQTAFLSGYLLCLGLITAIGAQNAFVLRQGLRGEHVLAVCLACALSDAALMLTGVFALSRLEGWLPGLAGGLRYGGALFLVAYGLRSLASAWRGGGVLDPAAGVGKGLVATLGVCLALTWLNPHVYLDSVLLVGSVAGRFGEARFLFAAGAIAASFSFFFALGYGARLLRPLFARPVAWRVLDGGVAVTMLGLAAGLVV